MVVEHIQKVKGKQKAFCIYVPESYMKHCGWKDDETIALYPNAEGTKLEIISMDTKKAKKEKESKCDCCCCKN